MIVRCGQCQTQFALDERQMGPEGMTVRCSVCKHVFRVEPPETLTVWQVLTTDGATFSAPDLATLREWIDEGRLHPDDQVSRTGRSWIRLGDMSEFADAFEGFENVAPVIKPVQPAAPPPAPPRPAAPPAPPPARPAAPPPTSAPASRPVAPPPTKPAPASVSKPAPPAPKPTPSVPATPPSASATLPPIGSSPAKLARVAPPSPKPAPPPPPPLQISKPEPVEAIDDDDIDLQTEIWSVDAANDERTRQLQRPSVPPPSTPAAAPDRPRPEPPASTQAPLVQPAVSAAPAPAPERGPKQDLAPEPVADDDLDEEFAAKPKRAIGAGLVAFLGVIAAVGVMFGVPSIRERLLSLGQSPSNTEGSEEPGKPADVPEIGAAERATQALGVAELAKAEAALQRKIDAGGADPTTTAAMKVALADLLLSRAIAYDIAASLDVAQREVYQRRADDDREDGERIIDSLEGAPDVNRLAEVRALARLAADRDEVEVLPLVPEGARETELIVRAAKLWRDDAAAVPDGLLAGLQDLDSRSGLGDGALALALVRAKDVPAARELAQRLLRAADDQIIGVALQAHLGAEPDAAETGGDETGAEETGDETGGEETGDEGLVAKAPPPPGTTTSGQSGSSGGGSGGSSFDRLLDKGCEEAHSGSAKQGIDLLLKAFDSRPNDLDVLVCLGDAYARQGESRSALNYYDRALARSPKHKAALAGAAKIAAKSGNDARATKLYETLLSVDPTNSDAKEYLANKKPAGEKPAGEKPAGEKPAGEKPAGETPSEPLPAPSEGG